MAAEQTAHEEALNLLDEIEGETPTDSPTEEATPEAEEEAEGFHDPKHPEHERFTELRTQKDDATK